MASSKELIKRRQWLRNRRKGVMVKKDNPAMRSAQANRIAVLKQE